MFFGKFFINLEIIYYPEEIRTASPRKNSRKKMLGK